MSRVSRAMTTIYDCQLRSDVGHHLFGNKRFDRVADLHVVEILYADTAFVPTRDFGSVFFEPLKRRYLPFENHNVVAEKPNFGIACNLAVGDIAACDHAHFRNSEGISYV